LPRFAIGCYNEKSLYQFSGGEGLKLSSEDVEHIALLARLGLSEEEIERFREQLSNILENFEVLQEIDTTDVQPTAHVIALESVVRDDEILPSWPQKEILENAPQAEDGYFRVRAVLE
jgi:aspartyl-tRNA(Asn)/glutamyl-tRNA(Gln) amidotransferase subunit C